MQTLHLQELAIAVAVDAFNPAVLSLDFLSYSGIIPSHWELAQPPLLSNTAAQIIFQNGVSISATLGQIVWAEAVAGKDLADVQVAAIAQNCVAALPNLQYLAIGINPVGYVDFTESRDAARQYILSTLLSPGQWQDLGQAPVRAAVQLSYTLAQGQLNLSVYEAALHSSNAASPSQLPTRSGVVFSANLNHDLIGTPAEQLQQLHQHLADWQADLSVYQETITTRFLHPSAQLTTPLISPLYSGAAS